MMQYLADFPELLDLMAAQHDSSSGCEGGRDSQGALGGHGKGQGYLFAPHLPMDDLLHGIKNKVYYKG